MASPPRSRRIRRKQTTALAAVLRSALLELDQDWHKSLYFLVPAAGGEHLALGSSRIQTLTPTSPLGRALLGLGVGDEAEVDSPQGPRVYEITELA